MATNRSTDVPRRYNSQPPMSTADVPRRQTLPPAYITKPLKWRLNDDINCVAHYLMWYGFTLTVWDPEYPLAHIGILPIASVYPRVDTARGSGCITADLA